MAEYIGSRISLISKSDIKYIGTLHEINSDTHTVALESVTSYGTEGRKGNPAEEIPGSDQVYEYIVFRGSDVKELTIVAPPGAKENQAPPKVPDDPAILGSARPVPQTQQHQQQQQPPNQNQFPGPQPPYPQQPPQFGYPAPPLGQFPGQPRFQGPGGPHGFPGTPGAVPGYGMGFGPPPGYYGPPPGHGFPHQPPPGNFGPNSHMPMGPPGQQMNQQRPPPQQMQGQQQPPAGSKQGTPQPQESHGPTPHPAPQNPVEMSATPGSSSATTADPPPPVDAKPPVAAVTAASAATQGQQPAAKPTPKTNNRIAVPLPAANLAARAAPKPATATATAPQPAPIPLPTEQPQSNVDATQAATAAVAAAMAKLGAVGQNQAQPQMAGTDNLTQQVNQMRLQDHHLRGRGRGRGRGNAPHTGRRESAQKQIDVPKEDYDFESANAKFNKQDLVKEATASGSPISSPANGEIADPLPAANGQVNGQNEAEDLVIPPNSTAEKGYDKKSSFFDNISSDLKDRIEQSKEDATSIDGRTMRREERTKNVETFGQGSVDQGGYRGGYRGRGRGRGFNNNGYRGGGGFRGGRGGFEGRGGGYRGRGARGPAEPTFV